MAGVDLFAAGAGAGFDEGWVKGSVQADVDVTGSIDARICHGIDLGVDIQAEAQAEARLRLLILGARGNVGVLAHAGVHGQVTLDPNIFERFGLTARIEAAAEVAARARLEIGLEAEYVAELAAQQLDDGLPLQLFLAFLREIRVGGGVMAKAAYCAMARARLEVAGSLLDGDGFTIGGGFAVGFKGGTGMDYFMRIGFDNPRRFFGTSVDLIIDEIVAELHASLPPGSELGIELFRLLAPVGLHTAYEVGQSSVSQGLVAPDQLIRPFLESFAEELQRYLVDKATGFAAQALADTLEEALVRLGFAEISDAQRQQVQAAYAPLQAALQDGKVDVEDLDEILAFASAVCELVSPAMLQRLRKPLSLLWTALTMGVALRQVGEAFAETSVSAFGVGVQARARLHPMPPVGNMPSIVRSEYIREVSGFNGTELTFDHAIDYLIAVGIGPLLASYTPELSALLDQLYQATDISPGNVVTFGIQGAVGGPVSETQLYQKLSAFIRSVVEEQIRLHVFQPFQAAAGTNPHARVYMDEVARPSIELMVSFVFDQLDAAVDDASLLSNMEYISRLQSGFSALLFKIVARNLVVLESIASETVRDNAVGAFVLLEQSVRSDETQSLVTTTLDHLDEFLEQVTSYVPGFYGQTSLSPSQVAAIQTFIADLLNMGQAIMSKNIFNESRWQRRRQANLALLLSLDKHFDWQSEDLMQEAVDTMLNCMFVPDMESIQDLYDLYLEILTDQCGIAMQRLPQALTSLIMGLTLPQINLKMDLSKIAAQAALAAWDAAKFALEALLDLIKEAARLADEALEALSAAIQQAVASLASLSAASLQAALVDKGKENLREAGQAIGMSDDVLNLLVDGFGFVLEASFTLVGPLIDTALNLIRSADFFSEALVSALDNISVTDLVLSDSGQAFSVEVTEKFILALDEEITNLFVPSSGAPPNPALTLVSGGLTALSPQDYAEVVFEAVLARLNLTKLINPILDQAYYEALETSAEAKKPAHQTQVNQTLSEYNAVRGRPGTQVEIYSPAPLIPNLDNAILYGPSVPLSLRLRPAGPGWQRDGEARRIQITTNGMELHFPHSAWTYVAQQQTLHLDTVLRVELGQIQPGLNVLEVSVAHDEDKCIRTSLTFMVDPEGPPANDGLIVDLENSQINPPGSDHFIPVEEYISLRWVGEGRLDLNGWRVRDRAGHEYVFGNRSLASGQTLRLRTGGNPSADTDQDVHWGRTRAVWNNTGDLVLVMDRVGTIRAQEIYGRVR